MGYVFLVVAALTAAITMFYTIRFLSYTFFGEKSQNVVEQEKKEGGHLHKTSPLMWVPLVLLAAGTIMSGWLGPVVEKFMASNTWFDFATTFSYHPHIPTYGEFLGHTFGTWGFGLTIGVLVLGAVPAIFMFVLKKVDLKKLREENKFTKAIYNFLYMRWYINSFYYICLRAFKKFCELTYEHFDLKVVDGSNYLIASGTMKSGEVFRKSHTGILSMNFIYMLIGAIILLAVFLLTAV